MKRNLKALGLALVAAFAMSAVAATAAQAEEQAFFTADAYPAVFKGAQHPNAENFFESTDGRRTECEVANYEGTLAKESTTVTITPHYDDCTASGFSASIDLNGCHFTFHAGTSVSTSDAHGTADVDCPAGNSIEIVAGPCTVHVPAQKGLTGVTFTNISETTVTVDVNIQNQIHYEDTDGFFCPFDGDSTGTNGDFVSSVLMHGAVDDGHFETSTGTTGYDAGAATAIHVKPLS